jgi:hypothetical protein
MTPATTLLAKHQKMHPPFYASVGGADRAIQIFGVLAPHLPMALRDSVANGAVAIGEIGRNIPGIQTIPIAGNEAIIEFNSGMMDFVYAVVRTLTGSWVRVTRQGAQNEPAASLTTVAHDAAVLFRQWKWPNRWIWAVRRIKYPRFAITEKVQGRAEEVAKCVESFLLAHELGHVAIDLGLLPPSTENVELRADAVGCGLMFSLGLHDVDLADGYGAAVLATRICVALEDLGIRFDGSYPKCETTRLESLKEVAKSHCPSIQYFHEISRIAGAYEDHMDDVEDHIRGRKQNHPPDYERILVWLIAQLLDVALGRLSSQVMSQRIVDLHAQKPPDIVRQVLHTLHGYYLAEPRADSFIDPETRRRMRQCLLSIMDGLPDNTKKLLVN